MQLNEDFKISLEGMEIIFYGGGILYLYIDTFIF